MKNCLTLTLTLIGFSAAMIALEPALALADHQGSPGPRSSSFYSPSGRFADAASPSFAYQSPFGSQGVSYPPRQLEEAIRQMYRDYLGRAPEPAGMQSWLDHIYYRGATLADVRIGILSSRECYNRFRNNPVEYVQFVFTQITGFQPRNRELDYWTRRFHRYHISNRNYFIRDMLNSLG